MEKVKFENRHEGAIAYLGYLIARITARCRGPRALAGERVAGAEFNVTSQNIRSVRDDCL